MTRVIQDGPPDRLEYGFHVPGDRDLLHHQVIIRDEYDIDIYSLVRKATLGVEVPTLGEWTTEDLDKVLDMYINPGDFKGVGRFLPKATYGDAVPVVVRTWSIDGTLHKVYSPLKVPQPLPIVGDLLISTVKLAEGGTRSIYTYINGPLTVGCLYYQSESMGQYSHEVTVYKCIAKVEDSNYLLLIISGEGLEAALIP